MKKTVIWVTDDEVKRVISKETLLSFPDFDKPFHVYTDASKYQLGSIIMQDDKPLAFYSCKLNPAQKRCLQPENKNFYQWWKHLRSLDLYSMAKE
jgi:RNase H-like domain found in reverse transcriptase